MTYTGMVAPFGMIVTENSTVSQTAPIRIRGSAVEAASGSTAHSRYQGWITGLSSTNAPSAMPRPSTGLIRRCQHCHMMISAMIEPMAVPTGCMTSRAAWVWSPRPSSRPASPAPTPSVVDTDRKDRTEPGAPSAATHPTPTPASAV